MVDFINLDGWKNVLSKVGISGKDKRLSHAVSAPPCLDHQQLTDMYHCNDLAYRICRLPAVEMTREWIKFKQETKGAATAVSDLGMDVHQYFDTMRVQNMFTDALTWSRLYGTSFIFVGADDGRSPASPLALDKIRSIRFMNILDRYDVQVNTRYSDPLKPNYGQPETYAIHTDPGGKVLQTRSRGNGERKLRIIHESRMLRFDGSKTSPRRMRDSTNGFADSVFIRLYSVLRGYGMTWDSVEVLMQDFAQPVFKIEGLSQMLKHDSDAVIKRMSLVDTSRSVLRSVVLDAEKEDYSRQATPLNGLPDILSLWMSRMAAAAEMPVTLLFGESPGGLNSTGESDERTWIHSIASMQEDVMRPNIERLLEMALNAQDGPTGGVEPDVWAFEFEPLRKPSRKEEAEIRKIMASADADYYDRNVLTEFEIALSRFGGDEYSIETKIDADTRMQMMDTEEDLADEPMEIDNGANPNLSGSQPDDAGEG